MTSRSRSGVAVLALLACAACSAAPRDSADDAARGIDSLNARITQAYRDHDPVKYAALFTDSAVFEWPAIASVRGPSALGTMARENWAALKNLDLELTVVSRRVAGDHATEFGAFEQSWDGDAGRHTEFGRYSVALVRQANGEWLMDRFLGFEDSTRTAARR
ncbi:MAG TPA: nuclear transport factor 2 family protein [Gemmatimonadaceae bacterium]|nr:nuclear transport factor 2 family protein [Gemmatimonadaceae bacterium]